MNATEKPQTIGFWVTTSVVVGSIIGAGIFLLPVSLAPLGANAIVSWLVSGVGILCIAYGMARLSRLGGQGIQANVEKEYGQTVAFLVAWSFWVSYWSSMASVAIGAASALAFAGIDFGGATGILLFSIFWLVALTAVNALGVRAAGGFSLVTVAIKLLPLLAVIWLLIERGVGPEPYVALPPVAITLAGVASATALTFWALTGFESATAAVGKISNPERTLPRALIAGTAFVVILYMFAGTAIQRLLPVDVIVASHAPFADALVSHWGRGIALFAGVTIAVSAIGCLNNLVLATGELGYSMALRGDLPKRMAWTRGVNTPVVAQVVGSSLAIILLLSNSSKATASLFTFTILLSTAATLVVYLTAALAAWRCSPRLVSRLVLAIGVLFLAFVTYGVGTEALLWCAVLQAIGLALRWVMHRLNERSGSTLEAAAS